MDDEQRLLVVNQISKSEIVRKVSSTAMVEGGLKYPALLARVQNFQVKRVRWCSKPKCGKPKCSKHKC